MTTHNGCLNDVCKANKDVSFSQGYSLYSALYTIEVLLN